MTALFRGDGRATRLILAAALLALAIRAAYVVAQTRWQLFEVSFVAADAVLYLDLARNIADGLGMSQHGRPTAYVGPGYPLFLAALLRVGADPLAVGLVQALLGALTAALAGLAAFELAVAAGDRERARWIATGATLVVALYPHHILWTGYLLTETLFGTLVAASFALTVRAANQHAPRLAALAGTLAGAAAVTRPPYLAVGVVIAAWGLAAALRGRWRRIVPLAFSIGLVLAPGAWAIRNLVELGAPIVTSTESGFVFYQGNSRGATGGSGGYVDARDFVPIDPPGTPDEVAKDRFYLERAIRDIAEDPMATVGRWPAKLVNMWRPAYGDASPRNIVISTATYVPVLALGILGAVALARRDLLAPGALPALVLATWVAIHVVVTGMIRFRLAAELVLIEVAPFGMLALLALWRRR